jgi:hypothetical protein
MTDMQGFRGALGCPGAEISVHKIQFIGESNGVPTEFGIVKYKEHIKSPSTLLEINELARIDALFM